MYTSTNIDITDSGVNSLDCRYSVKYLLQASLPFVCNAEPSNLNIKFYSSRYRISSASCANQELLDYFLVRTTSMLSLQTTIPNSLRQVGRQLSKLSLNTYKAAWSQPLIYKLFNGNKSAITTYHTCHTICENSPKPVKKIGQQS